MKKITQKQALEDINELVNHMLMVGYVGKGTPAEDKLEYIAELSSIALKRPQPEKKNA